jgi:hypothetical protein
MAGHSTRAALAALFTCASVLQAGAQSQFCPTVNGKLQLNYKEQPSLLFNAAEIEQAFPFRRAVETIVRSANPAFDQLSGDDQQKALEDFLSSMIQGFDNDAGFLVAKPSYVVVPVDDRLVNGNGEGRMTAAKMLDPTDSDFGMKPVGLFNRLDLADDKFTNCGEHRVVYTTPGGAAGRFLLIFEAAVPNPKFRLGDDAASKVGCRRIAEYWAGMTGKADPEIAQDLAQFYFEGKPGISPELDGKPVPVLSFRHLGGDGGKGQVRANMFVDNMNWQLREWLVQLSPSGLSFVPEPVKSNPIAELVKDDLAPFPIFALNSEAAIRKLHDDFIAHFTGDVGKKLVTEDSPQFNQVAGFAATVLDPPSAASRLITMTGMGSSTAFDEFQSVSQPGTTDRISLAENRIKSKLDAELAGSDITTQMLLERAESSTCSGCHDTSRGKIIGRAADETGQVVDVAFPQPAGRFVHIDEARNPSPALLDHFLPVRRLLMGQLLCDTTTSPQPSTTVSVPQIAAARPAYFADAIIDRLAPRSLPSATMSAGASALAAFNELSREERAPIAQAIAERVSAARAVEQQSPGAFVEVRRPH